MLDLSGATPALTSGVGRAWNLDLLRNLSGGDPSSSYIEYPASGTFGFDTETPTLLQHHNTNRGNQIEILREIPDPTNPSPVDQTIVYDAAGNLTEHQGDPNTSTDDRIYSYDAWNRLVEVQNGPGDALVRYAYDALGRRITRKLPDGAGSFDAEYYYYDGNRVIESGQLISGKNGPEFQTDRQYVYGLDYIDEHVAQYHGEPGTLHFTLTDANYNVVALTDSTGNVVEQYRYEPYGTRYAADEDHDSDGTLALVAAPDDPSSPLLNHYGHQGLLFDLVTGLVHNRGRDLNPPVIRYMQSDPNQTALLVSSTLARNAQTQTAFLFLSAGTQYADGMSLYEYVGSNPINGLDPSGLARNDWLAFVGGGISGYLYAANTLTVNAKEASILRQAALGFAFKSAIRLAMSRLRQQMLGFIPELFRKSGGSGAVWLAELVLKRAYWRQWIAPGGGAQMAADWVLSAVLDPLAFDSARRMHGLSTGFLDLPSNLPVIGDWAIKPIAARVGFIAGVLESALILAERDMG